MAVANTATGASFAAYQAGSLNYCFTAAHAVDRNTLSLCAIPRQINGFIGQNSEQAKLIAHARLHGNTLRLRLICDFRIAELSAVLFVYYIQ
jgi:hypothetical protein